MRIDSHVHYTPASMLGNLAEREPYWGLLLGPEVQTALAPEQMIDDMDRARIDKIVLMGNYWHAHDACVATNSELLALARRWPARILPFASIQPKAGRKAIDELRRCIDGGMRGLGELGAYGQGYRLDDADFLRLAEACIDHDIPLNLHVSEEVGHYYPGKSTEPIGGYYGLALRYPELKLVLAHWGGGLLFYEIMPEVRRALHNVYYDTAASPLLYPSEAIFRIALQCVAPAKILYGSDYPLPVCRKTQRGPDFRPFIAEIDRLDLEPETYDAIMGANAARLLGLADSEVRGDLANRPIGGRSTDTVTPGKQEITPRMAVSLVANAWPQTRAVFARFGIPWQDSPVPFWEPIGQAASARGLVPSAQQQLLEELNEAVQSAND